MKYFPLCFVHHLNFLLLFELRLTHIVRRKSHSGEGKPGLGLPALLEGQLDLIIKNISDVSLVVGSILPLHLHKKSVTHYQEPLQQRSCFRCKDVQKSEIKNLDNVWDFWRGSFWWNSEGGVYIWKLSALYYCCSAATLATTRWLRRKLELKQEGSWSKHNRLYSIRN